jgi:hypothetical protein
MANTATEASTAPGRLNSEGRFAGGVSIDFGVLVTIPVNP